MHQREIKTGTHLQIKIMKIILNTYLIWHYQLNIEGLLNKRKIGGSHIDSWKGWSPTS